MLTTQKLTTRTRDVLFALLMLAINGLVWMETLNERYTRVQEQDYGFDPLFFPRILLVMWALLAIVLLVRAMVSASETIIAPRWSHFALATGVMLVYIYAMGAIGFFFSSIPFVAAFLYIFGYRHRFWLPFFALVIPFLVWWIFVFLLQIPLPDSPWFVRM